MLNATQNHSGVCVSSRISWFCFFRFFQLWYFLGLVVAVFLWGKMWLILMMVAAISEAASTNPPNPKAYSHTHDTHIRNLTRPPLLPSEKDNGLVPKQPKSRQVFSRYMSPSSSNFTSVPKRCSSPLISCSTNSTASSTPLPVAMAMSTTTSDPLLLLSLISSKIGRHFVGFITGRRSQLSPIGNLPFLPFSSLFLSLGDVEREGKERKREGKEREREIVERREVWVATGDDTGKVPAGFTREERRGRWWVWEEKKEQKG